MGNSSSTVEKQEQTDDNATKLFVVQIDDNRGYVEVHSSHVLHDVRQLMKEEFDDDMLPQGEDYYFCCDGVRLSTKQERRLRCWDLMGMGGVSIHSRKRKNEESATEDETVIVKKPRTGELDEDAVKDREPVAEQTDHHRDKQSANTLEDTTTDASPSTFKHTTTDASTSTLVDRMTDALASAQSNFVQRGAEQFQQAEERSSVLTGTGQATEQTALDNCTAHDENQEQEKELATSNVPTVSPNKPPESEEVEADVDDLKVTGDDLPEDDAGATGVGSGAESPVFKGNADFRGSETQSPVFMGNAHGAASIASDSRDENTKEMRTEDITDDDVIYGSDDEIVVTGSGDEEATVAMPSTRHQSESFDTAFDDERSMVDQRSERLAISASEDNEKENCSESGRDKDDDMVIVGSYPEDPEQVHRHDVTIGSPASTHKQGEVNVGTHLSVSAEDEPIESDLDDEVVVQATEAEANAHKIHEMALEKSCKVLNDIDALLKENPLFCSEDRRQEWSKEIAESLAKTAPDTTIGVLGNTGVGKSSLLNALMDESAVLPTSGSRGCTAAVVELRYNSDLTDDTKEEAAVYKGEVEFITLGEWTHELRILVDECSTHEEKLIYARPPDEQRQPDAAAAWSKIDQVYGRGTMALYHGKSSDYVFQRLSRDQRVQRLLARKEGNEKPYNSVMVEEGQADQNTAKALLEGFGKMSGRLRRTKKKWAMAFRSRINDYVYRKGNGSEPQTWPLIRKVVLHGPWSVLSTGACLVDLPGVRDANVARAKVSEQYLQNCSQIWIVAPIKRAVDDGTAKELLGEQFKRRLLMDGKYGNVAFICTQTDDCEATETMRDHQDVAMQKPGRWEKMTDLSDRLSTIEKELADLRTDEEDLKVEYEDAEQAQQDAQRELKEIAEDVDDASVDNDDIVADLEDSIKRSKEVALSALERLNTWRESNKSRLEHLQSQSRRLQLRLKSLCAEVRNEYSKKCLQEDFRAGLEELTRVEDEEGGAAVTGSRVSAIPDDFEMDVYCISANDYLKIQGIKSSTDGPPNTFSSSSDTQIPSLRTFVHEMTARQRTAFTEAFVSASSDMLDRVKLVAADAKDIPSGRSSRKCKVAFENEMELLKEKAKSIEGNFRQKAEDKVRSALRPALEAGAKKGNAAAMATVASWGSKSRRSRDHRSPERNGLFWSTYFATVRRDGVYTSRSAGEVDFNQELCDPMEKEFSSDWQRIMDSSLRLFLSESEAELLTLCASVDQTLSSRFAEAGLSRDRITRMVNAANRSCKTAVKASFQTMKETAASSQRTLNRSLLPKIQAHMKNGYAATVAVPSGKGKFDRMKSAMNTQASFTVQSMFSESTVELLGAIGNMIEQLSSMIAATPQNISRTFESVYSVAWDNQSEAAGQLDPELQRKVRECRDKLLPDLNRLHKIQQESYHLLGLEREDLELDVLAVDSSETRIEKIFQNAAEKGVVIDLCDSDDDSMDGKPAARPDGAPPMVAVKTEPRFPISSSDDDSDGRFNSITQAAAAASRSPWLESDSEDTVDGWL